MPMKLLLALSFLSLSACSIVTARIPLTNGQIMEVQYFQMLRSYEVQFTQGKDGTVVTVGARSELEKLRDLLATAAAIAP